MNKTLTTTVAALIAVAGFAAPSQAAVVGVSISVGQPGFYGRIDMGDAPRPRIIYSQPRVIERVVVEQEPIYLHVRPGHARNWKRYCHQYRACGQRVYFVNHDWYNTVYVSHYRERDDHRNGRHDGRRDHRNRKGDRDRYDRHDKRDRHDHDEHAQDRRDDDRRDGRRG